MSAEEARALVARFEEVRRVYRGRIAAPVTELPADVATMTEALLTVADASDARGQRQVAEALLDLVAFVDPADADLINAHVRSARQAALAAAGADGRDGEANQRTIALLRAMRVQRARVLQHIRQDPSAVGDYALLGDMPVPIGEGRATLERVREGQEGEAMMMLAVFLVLLGTGVAFVIGSWWWLTLLVGLALSTLGAILLPMVGGWLDRALSRLEETGAPVSRGLINTVREVLVLVGGLGITIGGMVATIIATA
jgi:hypothetical protein